ncbi:MAG: hypothetical protein NT154_23285, partial [Verrucomicrobia bacterium]|nr:hypothetical protein [Verrucomicrobiota bacterium]
CCAIKARNSLRSSPESVRPWRQIGFTALRFYVIRGHESSSKCPNSSAGQDARLYGRQDARRYGTGRWYCRDTPKAR